MYLNPGGIENPGSAPLQTLYTYDSSPATAFANLVTMNVENTVNVVCYRQFNCLFTTVSVIDGLQGIAQNNCHCDQ